MATPPLPSQRSSASPGSLPSQRPSESPGSLPSQRLSESHASAAPPSQHPSSGAAPPGQNPSAGRAPSAVLPPPPVSSSASMMIQRGGSIATMHMGSQSPNPPATARAPKQEFSAQSGNVARGAESKSKAVAVLEKYRAPVALFPISMIDEFGFNEDKGLFWMKQPSKIEREFPDAEVVVHYGRVISGNVEANRIINLAGIKIKDLKEKNLFLPIPYNEIKVDGDQIMLLSGQGDPRAFSSSVFRNASVPQRPGVNAART